MPYTLAHPAATLPLRRWSLVNFDALVIGAMAPDYEHVLRLSPVSVYSHTYFGLLWFCLPVGWIVLLLYRALWRQPLARFFPQLRSLDVVKNSWRDGLGVLIGALTHVLWDGFTHRFGIGVKVFPVLNTTVNLASGAVVPVWSLLQHLSTGVGLTLLAVVIAKAAKRAEPCWWQREARDAALAILLLSLLSVLMTEIFWSQPSLKNLIVLTANNFLVLLAVTLTCAHFWQRRSIRSSRGARIRGRA